MTENWTSEGGAVPKPHVLTYHGDVRDIVGSKFHSEYLGERDTIKTWVATDAVYRPETDTTVVEFDELD